MLWVWTSLLLGALDVQVAPPAPVLGRDGRARIELTLAPPPKASLPAQGAVRCNQGQVSALQPAGKDRWQATYSVPEARSPSVALCRIELVQGAVRQHRWFAIPLQARAQLKLMTKPYAAVTVTVGTQVLAAVTADRHGRVQVPAVIPPGLAAAQATAVDRAGNQTTRPIPLQPPPFPQVWALPSRSEASWADPTPVTLEIFAVDSSGSPVTDSGAVQVTAKQGKVSAPVRSPSGAWEIQYQAPDHWTDAHQSLTVSMAGATVAEVPLEIKPGPPDAVAIALSAPEYVAGSEALIGVRTNLVDGRGNGLGDVRADFHVEAGKILRRAGAVLWAVPDHFQELPSFTIEARAKWLTGRAELKLIPAGPVAVGLTSLRPAVPAGASTDVILRLWDRFGNRTRAQSLVLVASPSVPTSVTRRADDDLGTVDVPDNFSFSSLTLHALADGVEQLGELTLPVVPRKPWALSAGGGLGIQSNLVLANSAMVRAVGSLRIARTGLQAVLEADGLRYLPFRQTLPWATDPNAYLTGHLYAASAEAGLRYSFPLSQRWNLDGTALGGIFWVHSVLSYSPFRGLQIHNANGPLVRVGMGPSVELGPGRLMMTLSYAYASVGGAVQGNLGGGALALDYLREF